MERMKKLNCNKQCIKTFKKRTLMSQENWKLLWTNLGLNIDIDVIIKIANELDVTVYLYIGPRTWGN